jgi:hypothetical protein
VESSPLITGAGVGTITTGKLMVESQPKLLVWVTTTEPEPGVPQITLRVLEVDEPRIVPPLTLQE